MPTSGEQKFLKWVAILIALIFAYIMGYNVGAAVEIVTHNTLFGVALCGVITTILYLVAIGMDS